MIEKTIKSLKDTNLRTYFGSHFLVKGEVKRVRFKNQRVFNELIRLGGFIEADRGEKESKNIPVILPEVDEDTIVGVEPVEIDSPEDEDQKPTVEELEVILKQKDTPPIRVLSNGEIRAGNISVDEAREPMSIETLEDISRTEPPIEELAKPLSVEELTPEQETEGQSEIEEIPIEEQDKSKPTRLSDIIDKP